MLRRLDLVGKWASRVEKENKAKESCCSLLAERVVLKASPQPRPWPQAFAGGLVSESCLAKICFLQEAHLDGLVTYELSFLQPVCLSAASCS